MENNNKIILIIYSKHVVCSNIEGWSFFFFNALFYAVEIITVRFMYSVDCVNYTLCHVPRSHLVGCKNYSSIVRLPATLHWNPCITQESFSSVSFVGALTQSKITISEKRFTKSQTVRFVSDAIRSAKIITLSSTLLWSFKLQLLPQSYDEHVQIER